MDALTIVRTAVFAACLSTTVQAQGYPAAYGGYAPYGYGYDAPRAVYVPAYPYYVAPRISYGAPSAGQHRAVRRAIAHPVAASARACLPPAAAPLPPIRAALPAAHPDVAPAAPALTPPREYFPPESFQQDRPTGD